MKPYQGYLIISERCNMKCTYCVAMYEKDSGVMSHETAKKAIKLLLPGAIENGTMILDFFGGEPTLFIKEVHSMCDFAMYLCQKNNIDLNIRIHTNGYAMNNATLDFYRCYKDNINVIVGIDGVEEVHDKFKRTKGGFPTYQTVLDNTKTLTIILGEDRVCTYTTIIKSTIPYLYAGYMKLQSEGLKHNFYTYGKSLECSPLKDESISSWTEEDFVEYSRQMLMIASEVRKGGLTALERLEPYSYALCKRDEEVCTAGTTLIAFSPDGRIHACHGYYAYDGFAGTDLSIGNVDEGITKDGSLYTISYSALGCNQCKNKGCSVCPSSNLAVRGDLRIVASENICKKSSIDNFIMNTLVGGV